MTGAERLNAATLLDRNLEAGRAEEPAFLTAGGSVTYGELASLTAAVASYLTDLGVQREQRVLMILDDSPAFPATFLGAMRIGAVPVPVNPMDRTDNFAYYIDDSYAGVLVVEATGIRDVPSGPLLRIGADRWVVPGRLPARELAVYFFGPGAARSIDAGVSTVGGLIFARLGRVPRTGDEVRLGNVALTVEEMRGRAVERVGVSVVGGPR